MVWQEAIPWEGMMKQVMEMIPYTDFVDIMKDNSRAFMMTDKADDCGDPPTEDQMMQCDEAMEIACEEASDSQILSF